MIPNLRNYTTSIPETRTITEIEGILAMFGATAILKDYNGDGSVKAISFKINTEHGEMPFKIPMNDRQIAQYLSESYVKESRREQVKSDLATARRIGWRIVKDWVHAQLSMVQTRLVKVEEIFLPYAFNYSTNKTFYEMLQENKFKGLLLDEARNK